MYTTTTLYQLLTVSPLLFAALLTIGVPIVMGAGLLAIYRATRRIEACLVAVESRLTRR